MCEGRGRGRKAGAESILGRRYEDFGITGNLVGTQTEISLLYDERVFWVLS